MVNQPIWAGDLINAKCDSQGHFYLLEEIDYVSNGNNLFHIIKDAPHFQMGALFTVLQDDIGTKNKARILTYWFLKNRMNFY